MLVGDGEPGAEVYTAANDRGQAGIVYAEAANMVRSSPHLRRLLDPVDSRKTIAYRGTASTLQALSADVPTKEGLNAHAVVVDELHAQRTRELWDVLEYAGAAREQPILGAISTAGVYDPGSIGWEQYDYAKRVLSDEIHDWTFLAVVFEAGKKDDWTDERTWRKANPSYGITISPDDFAQECAAAQQSPARQNSFRRYRLNQWTQQATRWIDIGVWDRNGSAHAIDEAALEGRRCYGGLDLSSVSDLTALLLAFPCDEDEEAIDWIARFWVPEARLTDEKNPNRALYQQWRDEGFLGTTPGNAVDYEAIIAEVLELAGRFNLVSLNIDRLFQGQHVSNRLTDELQVGEDPVVFPMGQGFLSFGGPMREFERRLLEGRHHHGGHPVLRWNAENAQVAEDAHENKKIVKQRTPQKVDGLVAMVMGQDRFSRHEGSGDVADSDYDTEGICGPMV